MTKTSVSIHPINSLFRGWKIPGPRTVRTVLKEAIAPWRIDDLAEGGKLVQAAATGVDFSTDPSWAREIALRELPQIVLRRGNARPHIIREIAGALGPAERAIELYSGDDLSGPLALPGIEYYQVSRDPVFSGLNELPQDFFDRIGLSELKAFNLARNFRYLTTNNIRRLTNLTYRACPQLAYYFEEVSAFSFRPEMQGQFDQAWVMFFAQASFGAVLNLLKTGGYFVYLHTGGFDHPFSDVESLISGMRELSQKSKFLLFRDDLSLDLSRRIFSVPGYDRLALTVNVFQKINERISNAN